MSDAMERSFSVSLELFLAAVKHVADISVVREGGYQPVGGRCAVVEPSKTGILAAKGVGGSRKAACDGPNENNNIR